MVEEKRLQKLLTPNEVSSTLGLHIMSVYRLARQGELPTVHIGRRLRFREIDVVDWLRKQNEGTR